MSLAACKKVELADFIAAFLPNGERSTKGKARRFTKSAENGVFLNLTPAK